MVFEHGSFEVGSLEVGSLEVGAFEVGSFEVGAFEVGSFEGSAFEVGPFEVGSFELCGIGLPGGLAFRRWGKGRIEVRADGFVMVGMVLPFLMQRIGKKSRQSPCQGQGDGFPRTAIFQPARRP